MNHCPLKVRVPTNKHLSPLANTHSRFLLWRQASRPQDVHHRPERPDGAAQPARRAGERHGPDRPLHPAPLPGTQTPVRLPASQQAGPAGPRWDPGRRPQW